MATTQMIKQWIVRFKSKPQLETKPRCLTGFSGVISVAAVAAGGSPAGEGGDATLSSPSFMLGVAVKTGRGAAADHWRCGAAAQMAGKMPRQDEPAPGDRAGKRAAFSRQALHLVKPATASC